MTCGKIGDAGGGATASTVVPCRLKMTSDGSSLIDVSLRPLFLSAIHLVLDAFIWMSCQREMALLCICWSDFTPLTTPSCQKRPGTRFAPKWTKGYRPPHWISPLPPPPPPPPPLAENAHRSPK